MPLRMVSPEGALSAWFTDFRAQLATQYGLLGIPPPICVHDVMGSAGVPELLMYFASAPWTSAGATLAAELTAYADAAQRLLPVLERASDAGTHLPTAVQRFNAFLRATHGRLWPEALVDEVLTLVWQRRRQRRIFISYRRAESREIARQLHDRYTRLGFDVFLDERSLEPAVDFQRGLRSALDASDAVLLLVSPGLTHSKWVREEIQFATTRRIGLLGLIWPKDGTTDPMATAEANQIPVDRRLRLAAAAPGLASEAWTLDDQQLADIDHLLFTGRSQAIASRVRDLVDSAPRALPTFTVRQWRPDGDLELFRDGNMWLGCAVPFRPGVTDILTWWEERVAREPDLGGIVILYPYVDPMDPDERVFRTMCAPWCEAARPPVLLQTVRV